MEAIKKLKDRMTSEGPSRLLNSALSHISTSIRDRAGDQDHIDLRSELGSRQSDSATPVYRTSDIDQLDNQSPIGPGSSSQFDRQHSSPSPIADDLEQAHAQIIRLQSQLARSSDLPPQREVVTPLFTRPSVRLVDQTNFWVSECDKYMDKDTVQLSIIENLLSEIKSLLRNFESLSSDKVRLEDQRELTEKYQIVRSYQMKLVSLVADIKDRNQARKNIKLLMPTFRGRALNYTLFKSEFRQWAMHLTETEKRVAFLKSVENNEIKSKISNASSYAQMVRILDSHFGNSQMINSKIFAKLQKLSKPSQYDFDSENKNIVKINS